MSGGIDGLTKKEQLDELEKFLDRLRAESERTPILVEGARDVAALRKLGLEGEILKLNRGEGLVERADGISRHCKNIILLTDWDYKGVELHDRLKRLLRDVQVETDDFFWSRLRKLVGGGSRTVEDLPAFLDILRERASSNC
jgi:5S rRNA maturation endonuclease (ribonuclease M5)